MRRQLTASLALHDPVLLQQTSRHRPLRVQGSSAVCSRAASVAHLPVQSRSVWSCRMLPASGTFERCFLAYEIHAKERNLFFAYDINASDVCFLAYDMHASEKSEHETLYIDWLNWLVLHISDIAAGFCAKSVMHTPPCCFGAPCDKLFGHSCTSSPEIEQEQQRAQETHSLNERAGCSNAHCVSIRLGCCQCTVHML